MNISIEQFFGTWLPQFFSQLVLVSAIGTVVVLAALLIQAVLSRYVAPVWMYVLWLLVIGRFALLVAPPSPTSFLNLLQFPPTPEIPKQIHPPNNWFNQPEFRIDAFVFKTGQNVAADSTAIVEAQSATASTTEWAWCVMASIWLLGCLVLATRLIRGWQVVSRIIERATPADGQLLERFKTLKSSQRVGAGVTLKITTETEFPAAIGFFRPVILLPKWCLEELDSRQQKLVLTHELVHVTRRDMLFQLLAHGIAILHWFNPLAWLATKLIGNYCELSCDRKVLAQFSQAPPSTNTRLTVNQRAYQRTLLQVAVRGNQSNHRLPVPVGGFASGDTKIVKRRIVMLQKENFYRRQVNLLAAICFLCLISTGFTSAQDRHATERKLDQETTSESQTSPQPFAKISAQQPTVKGQNKSGNPQAVKIAVKVYRVDRTRLKEMAIDWSAWDKSIEKGNDSLRTILTKKPSSAQAIELSILDLEKSKKIDRLVKSLVEQKSVTVAAAPTVTTLDQHTGAFMSGSEIPIAVVEEDGAKKTEFRFLGSRMEFTPEIRDQNQILLEVKIEQSELDPKLSATDGVPGFRVRRVNTGFKINDGETMAVVVEENPTTEFLYCIDCRVTEPPKTEGVSDKKPSSTTRYASPRRSTGKLLK